MALLERAQIELVDITDAQPAVLTLAANFSRIQTEENGIYSPNYEDNNLIITPTLYVGKNKTPINGKISYQLNSDKFEGIQNEDNYIINKNLENIDSVIITATISDDAPEGAGATAQIELVKLSNSSNKYTAFITSGGRSIFTPTDRNSIILTANLFLGATEIESGATYKWFKNGVEILNKNNKTYEVTVDDINSMSNYYCEIVIFNNIYLTSSITIMDKTDPYSSQIISSDGLIFTSDINTTKLICNVYQSNKLIEDNINYAWYKNSTSGNLIGETKEITVVPQEENASSVTYYCIASINGAETTSQITLIISPAFEAVVEPKQIFIPFIGNTYDGEQSYLLKFYLRFSNNQIKADNIEILYSSISDYFDLYDLTKEEDNYHTFSFNIKNDVNDFSLFPDSTICSIKYTYRGVSQQQEFYFIKNIKGADLSVEEDTIIEYCYSNNGVTPPETDTGSDGFVWYDNPSKIPLNEANLNFLWIRTTRVFSDGENKISYTVQKNGKNIVNIEETYALGNRIKIRIIDNIEKINYDENKKRTSIVIDGIEWSIFEQGEIIIENNNIYDINGNLFSSINDLPLVTFSILYNPDNVSWNSTVPISSFENDVIVESEDFILYPVEEISKKYIEVIRESPFGESLWIKYNFIYEGGEADSSEPTPFEAFNDLRLSASRAETLYNNDSIKSIVQKTDWGRDENGQPYNLATYITQMPDSILSEVVTNETFARYFKMGQDGLTIGEKGSHFVTLTDDISFNIKYFTDPYDPDLTTQDGKIVGSFSAYGLSVSQIILENSLTTQDNQINNNIIILQGTNTGGYVWIKGARR